MQKRGQTAAGTQRWLCLGCSQSHSLGHDTQKRGRLLDRFVSWLLGKQSQAELAQSFTDRALRTQTAWCWEIVPKPEVTGEVHEIILLDGIRVGNVVCLVARAPSYVIGWHWVPWEAGTTWSELLDQFPPPIVVVCDGQKGILVAIRGCWPTARIQRCIFHVWQNVRVKLTLHPKTEAGRELLQLTRELLRGIPTKEAAQQWQEQLQAWETQYASFIRERTYLDRPTAGRRRWWYTHRRLRSAYRQLNKLLQNNQLFTYLETDLTSEPIPRTTNYVEGGINSQLRTKLKLHRGMSQEHQRRLVEWYLYSRTESPKPPRNFL